MSVRRDLLSGVVVLAPIAIVLYVIYWVFTHVSLVPLPLAPTGQPAVDAVVKAVLVLLGFLVLFFAVGRGTRTFLGKGLERGFDRQMNRIPALRIIYNASKVALEMVIRGAQEYRMPVLVRVTPERSLMGFKTGTEVVEGRETVFVPTAPNITSGMILYVETDRLVDVDESTEEVLTHVISAGFLKPGEAETEEVESLLGFVRRDG